MSGSTEWQRAHLTETYKALITLAVEALKMLALVNGGAAVALVTYLGNLVSHGPGGPLPNLSGSVVLYSLGLLMAVVAFVVAYVTQLRLYVEERTRFFGQPVKERHYWGILTGVALAVFSAIAFGAASWKAAHVLLGGP